MSEWLDLLLEEIERKKQEQEAAREEAARRNPDKPDESVDPPVDDNPG